MLTAKDSWGRTLISHGILSGNPQVFEVAVEAVRADVLDEEVKTNRNAYCHENLHETHMLLRFKIVLRVCTCCDILKM